MHHYVYDTHTNRNSRNRPPRTRVFWWVPSRRGFPETADRPRPPPLLVFLQTVVHARTRTTTNSDPTNSSSRLPLLILAYFICPPSFLPRLLLTLMFMLTQPCPLQARIFSSLFLRSNKLPLIRKLDNDLQIVDVSNIFSTVTKLFFRSLNFYFKGDKQLFLPPSRLQLEDIRVENTHCIW